MLFKLPKIPLNTPPPITRTTYLQSVWVKGVRKHVVKDITPPDYPWQPMLVLANRKSGDGMGQSVLQKFRYLLNPVQVCSGLAASPTYKKLNKFQILLCKCQPKLTYFNRS